VRDWFVGRVTSRRFLTLIDGLPDESLFKTWAVRGGDWTQAQYITARLVNEVALSRADGKGYHPELIRSPTQMAAEQAEDEWRRRRHRENLNELTNDEEDTRGDHR